MPGLVLVTAPVAEPLSLTDAKLYCKVEPDQTTDDDLIAQLLTAARTRCESRQGMAYITQTWDLFLDGFPDGAIEIPLSPLQSITSIKYTKADNTETTLSAGAYYVDTASKPGRVLPVVNTVWPTDQLRVANGVAVRFVAGYLTEALVPEPSRNALRELLVHYYEHRNVTPEIPAGIEAELWESGTRQYA